jgi:hypothetical protein
MRYILAMFCPPLALLICGRPKQAATCAILFIAAIATAEMGVGLVFDVFLVIWATNAVGDEGASRETLAFKQTVRPILVARD